MTGRKDEEAESKALGGTKQKTEEGEGERLMNKKPFKVGERQWVSYVSVSRGGL